MTRWLYMALVLALAMPAPLPAAADIAGEAEDCASHSESGSMAHSGHAMPMAGGGQSMDGPERVTDSRCDHCDDDCDSQDCGSECIGTASTSAIILRSVRPTQWLSAQCPTGSNSDAMPLGHARVLFRPPIHS